MNAPLVVELEIPLDVLAGIYRMQNWPLDFCDESTPTASDLAELITHVAMHSGEEGGTYACFGRVVAFTDAEVPGVIELALKIGYARPELGPDADKPIKGDTTGEAL